MKPLPHLIIVFTVILAFSSVGIAETVTLPDGQEVPLEGLSSDDKKVMIYYLDKISKAQKTAKVAAEATSVMNSVKEAAKDPGALREWSLLITDTLKTVATDLNVSVNEFIKTPAGMGVAALIIYKVMGKEVLETVFDVIFAIPMWITVMLVLWYVQRQYLTSIVVYNRIEEIKDEKTGKTTSVVRSDPEQAYRYSWSSSDSRTVLGAFVYGTMLLTTLIAVIIVFT